MGFQTGGLRSPVHLEQQNERKQHLQEIEGRWVEEEEGHKVGNPDDSVHKRLPTQVPERRSVISVVYKVHNCKDCQREAETRKQHSEGPSAYDFFSCSQCRTSFVSER